MIVATLFPYVLCDGILKRQWHLLKRYIIVLLPSVFWIDVYKRQVTASDKTGIVSISMAQRKAALTFKNKKTRYDRYSHTDVVTNIVPVS